MGNGIVQKGSDNAKRKMNSKMGSGNKEMHSEMGSNKKGKKHWEMRSGNNE